MTSESGDKAVRIERLRAIVNEDYDRIAQTEDPYTILNLEQTASWEDAAARYERYERFYRAENFQRLGDMDLTRKALDVRRAVGRAIVEIQGRVEGEGGGGSAEPPSINDLDPSSRALGDIYFRDGLTYLRLGDLDSAIETLQRAAEYDPTRGIILAYHAYTSFRRRSHDPDLIEEARRSMLRAARIEAGNADVHVLVARFFLKIRDVERAVEAIDAVKRIDPKHAKLEVLAQRLAKATS